MRLGLVLYLVGALICILGLTMFPPFLVSMLYKDSGLYALLGSMAIAVVAGAILFALFRKHRNAAMGHREAIGMVALGWVAAGLVGGLPYLLGGVGETWSDAFFESFSGFTTTGASILTNIEAVPHSLLLWRSLTHWLGGMGIIVLSLAILPMLGVGGMQLYKAEAPGPSPDKLTPRIKDTALLLWKVYVLFTALQVVLLLLGGMNLFDAVCHAFATMATGGFSTKNASIGHFQSVYIDVVVIAFMFLAGMNFALHYSLLRGRPVRLLRDPEFRFYALVLVAFTLVGTWGVYATTHHSLGEALRYAAFQVVSIGSTTGFATDNYELWLPLPQVLLFLLMFLGGCAGSTAGGMKCMRIMLLAKQSYQELFRLAHPRVVNHVKMGGKKVPPEALSGIWGFFLLFLGLFLLAGLLLMVVGLDASTAFSSAVACLGNIGPGFGDVGPMENYAGLPAAAKWLLVLCMLLGRLEIYTVFILFVPEFWRK